MMGFELILWGCRDKKAADRKLRLVFFRRNRYANEIRACGPSRKLNRERQLQHDLMGQPCS